MSLIIYTLSNCKVCQQRQRLHNHVHQSLAKRNIELYGEMFGNITIDGKSETRLPHEEHDQLCRKEGDATKYTAPVYILEVDDTIAKIKNISEFANLSPEILSNDNACKKVAELYADYIE